MRRAHGNRRASVAIGPQNTAGQSSNATSIVDGYSEDNDLLPSTCYAVGTEGLAMRPFLTPYGAMHPEHVEVRTNRYYTRPR